jgi:hypothetical protein
MRVGEAGSPTGSGNGVPKGLCFEIGIGCGSSKFDCSAIFSFLLRKGCCGCCYCAGWNF